MTLQRQWIPTPNFSSGRSRNQLMVIHSAEGADNFVTLGDYFSNPHAQVSAHVGIDDTPGMIGEYANRNRAVWAAFAANDWGVHAETCAFAAWTRDEWLAHPQMLRNLADWCMEEGAHYGIPCRHVDGNAIRNGEKGFCSHADVVAAGAGGNHWDPGTGFPWDVLENLCVQSNNTNITTTVIDGGNLMAFGPDGTRVDTVVVGTDHRVWHTWAANPGELMRSPWESLGGYAKSIVKDGWLADKSAYVVIVVGSDDHPYVKVFDAKASKWGGWVVLQNGLAFDPVPNAASTVTKTA